MSAWNPIEALAQLRHEFGEHGGVNPSIEVSTTFTVLSAETMPELFRGRRGPETAEGGCFLYGRHFNPTVYVLGRQLSALEGTEAGYCTASGMSAIACAILQSCAAGDHVVSGNTIYGGTYALLHDFLPRLTGIRTSFVPITDLAQVEAACTERTRVLYCETVSNPTLDVADVPALAAIARRRGLRLIVDNTFAPLIVSPARLGADVVVHSLTKFISGASDVIAGAICASNESILKLMDLHTGSIMLLGPTMDPRQPFEVSLRLPHLGLRMAEHSRRALTFATRLAEMKVPVTYPGLPDHPSRPVLERIMNPGFGYGGILGIDLGSSRRAAEFMEILQNKDRFGFMAVSLGYFETLLSCSASSTSSELSDEDMRKAGIQPGYVRMSVGYTGTLEQRWSQLVDALSILNLV